MNTLKLGLFSFLLILGGLGIMSTAPTSAAPTAPAPQSTAAKDACDGLTQIDASHDCQSGDSTIGNIIKAAVSILSYVIGAVAIVMVIIAGLKYSVSAGDSGRISSAKNTLVYALIGLAVAALAQILVHFVFDASVKASNGKAAYSPTSGQGVIAA